jgi:L-alanine-DL-glutamate epimerase-like enolase superfamily enzyme
MTTESLRIEAIEIYQSVIKLKEPFIISLGILTHAENIIVVIKTNKEITGFGECSPFMTINGESVETAFVVGRYLPNIWWGKILWKLLNFRMKWTGLFTGIPALKALLISPCTILLHNMQECRCMPGSVEETTKP